MSRPSFRILPLEYDDIPELQAISQAAFATDQHTLMKMNEKGVTDLGSELEPRSSIEAAHGNPAVRMLKAVDEDGKLVGFSNWRMWNFDKDLAPTDAEIVPLGSPVVDRDFPVLPSMPALEQLGNTTSGHLFGMMNRLNRPDTRTFFCTGISVHPDYQSKGVGSQLLNWVTAFADEHDAQSWVHLSDNLGGVRAFEKKGYKVVNSITVDLNQYASKPKPGGGEWGPYTFRFLLRQPHAGAHAQ